MILDFHSLTARIINVVIFSRNGVVLSNVSQAGGVDFQTVQQLTRLTYEMLISQRSKFVATQLMQRSIVAIAKSSLAALLIFDEAHSITPLERAFTILILNTILHLSGRRLTEKVNEFVELQRSEENNVTATSSRTNSAARERLQEWFSSELAYVPALCEDTLFCEQFTLCVKNIFLL